MVRADTSKRRIERFEERFDFQGDAIAVVEGPILRTALHRVLERTTGAERMLRIWRKTGTSADRDLRQLWEHERRQVQRLMSTAGADDLVVSVMEFVDGKVARETQYFADPFEPGPSRAEWVERME